MSGQFAALPENGLLDTPWAQPTASVICMMMVADPHYSWTFLANPIAM
jgi:hypothetical protein